MNPTETSTLVVQGTAFGTYSSQVLEEKLITVGLHQGDTICKAMGQYRKAIQEQRTARAHSYKLRQQFLESLQKSLSISKIQRANEGCMLFLDGISSQKIAQAELRLIHLNGTNLNLSWC
eukprot:15364855-Ditylum_brightwellii.AAC.1